MIKALFIDADGVAIRKHEYFSEVFSRESNVPLELVSQFFKGPFSKCATGEADLKELLPEYLRRWGWRLSLDDFLNYWFAKENHPDQEVLKKVYECREKGVRCYLVTDQEKYRARFIEGQMGFEAQFDKCFFSCDLHFKKSDPEFFLTVLAQLGLFPDEAMYFDDDSKNIEVGKRMGINSVLVTNPEDVYLPLTGQ